MAAFTDTILDEEVPRARVALLLEHFSELGDDREPWRVMYPLKEVLLLVVCATIASCDDFYDIVAWGEHHLDFLRRFAAFHHGIPCKRWVRMLVNRVDPVLFARGFGSWVEALWPGRHDLIAIDGKTARRTHDQRKGLKALHTLSAYASSARLVLAQLSVPEKTNEITAIPDLLDELAEAKQLKGALVTIDAMGCQVEIANKIIAHQADYLLALKGNQLPISSSPKPPLRRGMVVSRPASTPPRRRSTGSCPNVAIQPSHASPTSRHSSRSVAAPSRAEHADRGTFDTRYFICSAPLDIDRLANGIRATGVSKACTGSWMSSSRTICRATGPVTVPRTWLSSDASPSAWYAPTRPREASKPVESAPAGTRNSCSKSSSSNDR